MKKIISLFLSIVVIFCVATSAVAAGNSFADATIISTGTNYDGNITTTNTKDVYKFTLGSSGRININLQAYIYRSSYFLYDADGILLWEATNVYWNDVTEMYALNNIFDLTEGTYYFAIEGRYSSTGTYDFSISFTSARETFEEPLNGNNNELKYADGISLGSTYKGQIAKNDSKDIYSFELDSSGRITLTGNIGVYRTSFYIYDANGNVVWELTNTYWNDVTEIYTLNTTLDLIKGTYYFAIEGRYGNTGNYNFKVAFKSSQESFVETLDDNNNEIKNADKISLGKTYKGQIAKNDSKDFYTFDLSSSCKVVVSGTASIYRTSYYLYDVNGNVVGELKNQYWNDTTQKYTGKQTIDLSAGKYYFAIEGAYGNTGNYSFTVAKYIPAPSIKGVSNTDSGIKVTWGKSVGASGYLVYRKTSSGTWSQIAKTSKTAYIDTTAKSGATYYYTVRAYSGSTKSEYDNDGLKVKRLLAPKLSKVENVSGGVKFTWGKVTGAGGYIVYRKTSSGSWTEIAKTTKTYYTDKTAKSGVTYYYTARAYSGTVKSSYNAAGIKVKYLSTPKLASKENTTSGVKISWGKVTGASGYIVYRKTSGGTWTEIGKTTKTSYTDKKAKSGTTYYYTVRAYNGSVKSAYNGSGLKLIRLAPTNLGTPKSTKSGITLKWSKVAGAEGYAVFRKTGSGSYSKIATVKGASKVSYVDKTAKKGKKYTYAIKVYSGKAYSAGSNAKTITDKY